jgi:hypothetical protein
VAGISEELLAEYQRVAKSRGTALAAVVNESCHACGMHVRPHVYQVLRRAGSEEIFHCETCARILYYAEPAVPAGLVREETTAGDGAASGNATAVADATPDETAEEKSAAQATSSASSGGQ